MHFKISRKMAVSVDQDRAIQFVSIAEEVNEVIQRYLRKIEGN